METVRVGRRKWSDPDVLALIRATGELVDPRSVVLSEARKLNATYRQFESEGVSPFDRLVHLASLRGLQVLPMDTRRRRSESRDAVVLLHETQKRRLRGTILYNPDRPQGRVAFSLGHEIAHTFFPTTSGGARFREMCNSDSREANELERLCDAGAAEILMPINEFREAVGLAWSLSEVPRLTQRFGASFEACAFRLASAHPGIAAAGLLKFRRRKNEQRAFEAQRIANQQELFKTRLLTKRVAEPRYRRQSFHTSDEFPDDLVVPWNKSFDENSLVYRHPVHDEVLHGTEALPVERNCLGQIEVARALFQREDADVNYPDLLFFWTM